MPDEPSLVIAPPYQSLWAGLALESVDQVWTDPRLVVWRDLPERQNATLDVVFEDRPVRLHVKRDKYRRGGGVADEAVGLSLLTQAGIDTPPLVAHGRDVNGRTFIITRHLDHHRSADRLLEEGMPFERLLGPTAALAAKLHDAGLHHRDLYLNHFYIDLQRPEAPPVLLDAGRVRRRPAPLGSRWVVKDVAQFLFSCGQSGVDRASRARWLRAYRDLARRPPGCLGWRVWMKVRSIASHDAALRRRAPARNRRLPGGS